MNELYSIKAVCRYLLILVAVMMAMKWTNGTGFLVVIPILFIPLARGKAVDLMFYLLVVVAMLMGNQWLMPKNFVFAVSQRGLMVVLGGIMAVRCFGRKNSSCIRPLLALIFYLLVVSVSSFYGWCPLISFLKLLLFVMIYFAYYGAANEVANDRKFDTQKGFRSVFLSFAIFFIIGSVLLIPFPAISQLSGEEFEEAILSGKQITSLFKGMTMHSQSLGPIMASLCVALLGDLVFSIKRRDRLYLLLILLCPVLIYKTSSRTAMGSLFFGVMILVWEVFKDRAISTRWRGKIVSTFLLVVIAFSGLAVGVSGFRSGIVNYALKFNTEDKDGTLSLEDVTATRKEKWEEGIANFKQSLLIGNGFQVSEDMAGFQSKSISQLLTAPVEKSVWISAVLEESGVLGFSIFIIFIVAMVTKGLSRKCYIGTASFLTLLCSNLGEFTFFSMSYTGGFQWAVVFVAYTFDALRLKSQAMERRWSWC